MSTSSDNTSATDPVDLQKEAAKRLVDLFVNGGDDDRQAIANMHGDRTRGRC